MNLIPNSRMNRHNGREKKKRKMYIDLTGKNIDN